MSIHEPLIGFGLKKNLQSDMGIWSLTTNDLGFREKESIPFEKLENEFRLFILGGSTVFGWGVPDEKSIPAQLQTFFEKKALKNKKVRVINAGVPWYASAHELSFALYRVLPLKPDAIWVLDGLNDTAQAIAPTWTPDALGHIDLASSRLFSKQEANPWWENLLQLSHTLTFVRAKLKTKDQLKTGIAHPEANQQYLEYHRILATVLKEKKIDYRVFLQPVLALGKTVTDYEKNHNGTSMRQPAFEKTFVQQYESLERELHTEFGFNHHSLKNVFQTLDDSAYLDGLHYNALANGIIAKEMFELAHDMPNLFL